MVKVFKKLLICLCIMLTLVNFLMISASQAAEEDDTEESIKNSIINSFIETYNNTGGISIGTRIANGLSGIAGIIITIPKLAIAAVVSIVQVIGNGIAGMAGRTDGVLGEGGTGLRLTIDDIVFNKLNLTSIDFFNINGLSEGNIIREVREQIALWYYVMRTIAIVILLAILIVVGIRMAITTVASDKAIYKKALFDWVTSLALVFLLHYIIRGVLWINTALVNILNVIGKGQNLNALMRALDWMIWDPDFCVGIGSLIIYIILTIQTLMFLITYIKRMLTLAFLIIISPLISITYSIDKMGDQKAQALNTWLKEFAYNVLIQPFHCILYLVFVTIAIKAVNSIGDLGSMVFAILCIKFIWDGEKIVRKIFGFEQASSLGAVAASGAMIGAAIQKARSAGSKATSTVKFASNTKTGQLLKQKWQNNKAERKELKGLGTKDKLKYAGAKRKGETDTMENLKKKAEGRRAGKALGKALKKDIHDMEHPKRAAFKKNLKNKAKTLKKGLDKVNNSELGQAIRSDAGKFVRKLARPENVAKVGAALMASAALYALPDQNLVTAVTAGYAAGKSAETAVNNIKNRKKESFEDNAVKAWERHCEINKIPEGNRTREGFETWYNTAYLHGKQKDAYSAKSMNKEESNAEKKLREDVHLDPSAIDEIINKIQRAMLAKEDYKPEEMFSGYTDTNGNSVSAEEIAAAVAGYANKFNNSCAYEDAANYNAQMSPYGVDYTDAISGISEEAIGGRQDSGIDTTVQEYFEDDVADVRASLGDNATADDIMRELESRIDEKVSDATTAMENAANELTNSVTLAGGNSTELINQINEIIENAINSGAKDIQSQVQSQINSLNLTGDVSRNTNDYVNATIEFKYRTKEKEGINREDLRAELERLIK